MPLDSAMARAFSSVAGGVGNLSSILKSGWKAVKCQRDINGVFGEDDRIIVREGHSLAAEPLRRPGDRLWGGGIRQAVDLTGFADTPILAELAAEVAARRAEGEHAGAGVKVVERF